MFKEKRCVFKEKQCTFKEKQCVFKAKQCMFKEKQWIFKENNACSRKTMNVQGKQCNQKPSQIECHVWEHDFKGMYFNNF